MECARRPVVDLYAELRARQFGPRHLESVRDCMIERGWSSGSFNASMWRVRQMFKWATS
jgi:hypothetical protein